MGYSLYSHVSAGFCINNCASVDGGGHICGGQILESSVLVSQFCIKLKIPKGELIKE